MFLLWWYVGLGGESKSKFINLYVAEKLNMLPFEQETIENTYSSSELEALGVFVPNNSLPGDCPQK